MVHTEMHNLHDHCTTTVTWNQNRGQHSAKTYSWIALGSNLFQDKKRWSRQSADLHRRTAAMPRLQERQWLLTNHFHRIVFSNYNNSSKRKPLYQDNGHPSHFSSITALMRVIACYNRKTNGLPTRVHLPETIRAANRYGSEKALSYLSNAVSAIRRPRSELWFCEQVLLA